jgi:hypothetical protein
MKRTNRFHDEDCTTDIYSKLYEKFGFDERKYKYGITPKDREEIDKKIDYQRRFMQGSPLRTIGMSNRTLYDFTLHANHSKFYYAEMQNRVNTFKKYCDEKGWIAFFLTITVDSEFHPLKVVKKIVKNKKTVYRKFVDNNKYCFGNTPIRAIREYLSPKWKSFLNLRFNKRLKELTGKRMRFMKTYEPTVDGTPHLHVVGWIHESIKKTFISSVESHFDARTDLTFPENPESSINYIMKYIVKSFSKDGLLNDVGYWFVKHNVRRFTTSRTLAPLSIYRKVRALPKHQNYLEFTKKYERGFYLVDYYIGDDRTETFTRTCEELKEAIEYEVPITIASISFGHEQICLYSKDKDLKVDLFDGYEERAEKVPKKLNNRQLIVETEYYKEYRRGNKTLYRFDKRKVPPKTLRELTKKELQGQLDSHYEFMPLSVNERHAIENELNFRGVMF